jgi:nicotinamide-nucleotide adenylyltransferase
VLIGIGSAEENFTPSGPFTSGERFVMLESALRELGIDPSRYAILPARNINNYALWVNHIKNLFPPFARVYTGSPIVKELFEKHGEHKVVDLNFRVDVCATQVREKILNGEDIGSLVPKSVEKVLKEWDAVGRIRKINPSPPSSCPSSPA